MMEQGHKVLFVLVGLAVMAALLGAYKFKSPVLIAFPEDDTDAVRLGMSATNNGTTKGPWQLTANTPIKFPPPLQFLTASTDLVG